MKTQLIGAAIVVALIFAVARSSDPARKAAKKKNKAEAAATLNEKKHKQAEKKAEKRAAANINSSAPRLFETPTTTPAQAGSSAVNGSSGSIGTSAGTPTASTVYNTMGTSAATPPSDPAAEAFTGTGSGSSSGSSASEASTSSSAATTTPSTPSAETTETTATTNNATTETSSTSDISTEPTPATETPKTSSETNTNSTNTETTTTTTTATTPSNTESSTNTPATVNSTVFPETVTTPTPTNTPSVTPPTPAPVVKEPGSPPKPIAAWFPFVLADTLFAESPANAGTIVLDAPAGRHGFLKVTNGNFAFEDGTPIQFWGTNLAIQAPFPEKSQAQQLVDRIAFMGFNAVRFHNIDNHFSPYGVFKDVVPNSTNAQAKNTSTLSDTQLDKLDYLISLFRKKGIYVVIDLLVGRTFTEADGMNDADKFLPGARPVCFFDPALIALQKTFANNLLNHFNIYTQTRYKDDPTIAFIELTNEVSLLEFWFANGLNGLLPGQTTSMPAYYISLLDQQWNDFLSAKYGTVNAVKSAWAFTGDVGNAKVLNTANNISLWKLAGAGGTTSEIQTTSTEARITISQATGNSWDIQYARSGFALTTDKSYRMTFTAKASSDIKITIDAQQSAAPYGPLKTSEHIPITTTASNYELTFTPTLNSANSKINFALGRAPNIITLSNIVITEYPVGALSPSETTSQFDFARPLYKDLAVLTPQKASDITSFYYGIQSNYFTDMKNYLKNTIGIRVPITGVSGTKTTEDITTQASMDTMDFHYYWDHPHFPNGWSTSNFQIPNTSMLADPKLGIIGKIVARSQVVPESQAFTITEWNHCYPGTFAYETPVALAALQRKNGYDGLFQFSFATYPNMPSIFQSNKTFFDIAGNTQQLALSTVASFVNTKVPKSTLLTDIKDGIFTLNSPYAQGASGALANNTIQLSGMTILSKENAAIFAHPIDNQPLATSTRIMITIAGPTKDTNAAWNGSTFTWGTTPVLLKSIDASISITNNNQLRAFALDTSGKRASPVPVSRNNGIVTLSTLGLQTPWIELTTDSTVSTGG